MRSAPQPTSPTGQGFLARRLQPDLELPLRFRTGIALWGSAAISGAIQQFGPIGYKMPTGWFIGVTAIAAYFAWRSYAVHPRMKNYIKADPYLIVAAWITTALYVYASGGATSPYTVLFSYAMLYSAYFLSGRQAILQLGIGTTAASLPLFYDNEAAQAVGFGQSLVVAIAVFWSMSLMIGMRRRALQRAEQKTRRMALTDPLTGVANLRAFQEFGDDHIADCRAGGTRCAFVMVDLNGLKQANTVYGHAGGDEMIVRLSKALLAACGENDQVGRVGGDEFAVLISAVDDGTLARFDERLAEALAADARSQSVGAAQVSASIGGAIYPQDGDSLEELMRIADARMYECKAASKRLAIPLREGTRHGGRMIHEESEQPQSIWHRAGMDPSFVGAATWFAVGALLLAGLLVPGISMGKSQELALPAAACLVVGLIVSVGIFRWRSATLAIGDVAVVLVTAPMLVATGGHRSALITVVVLTAAYMAFYRTLRAAVPLIAGIQIAFAIGYWWTGGVGPAGETLFVNVVSMSLIVAGILRLNARALDKARAEADRLAHVDPLTAVANRRAFEERVSAIATGTSGDDRPALILVDLDNFKQVNTSLGHRGGDRLLQSVADRLRAALRDAGTVYRLGGDEFGVIADVPSASAANEIAERCRVAVHGAGQDLRELGTSMQISASFGFAIWDPTMSDTRQLMAKADGALQRSKDVGKDAISEATFGALAS